MFKLTQYTYSTLHLYILFVASSTLPILYLFCYALFFPPNFEVCLLIKHECGKGLWAWREWMRNVWQKNIKYLTLLIHLSPCLETFTTFTRLISRDSSKSGGQMEQNSPFKLCYFKFEARVERETKTTNLGCVHSVVFKRSVYHDER